jgi:hypothetical protein
VEAKDRLDRQEQLVFKAFKARLEAQDQQVLLEDKVPQEPQVSKGFKDQLELQALLV